MALDKEVIDEINRRIALGHTYARIHREMGLDWWDVRNSAQASWRATRRRITNRLDKLVDENDPSKRANLVQEIKDGVAYLHESGKALGAQIDRIEKILNG